MNIEVLHTKQLNDFPSGSSMEFYKNILYLAGDDAQKLLLLDTDYNILDSVHLFDSHELRIPKKKKADLEASAIINYQNKNYLLVLGSASKEKREKIILLALDENKDHSFEIINTAVFVKQLLAAGIEEVNIEGAAAIGNEILLSNRGNKNRPDNHLIKTVSDFFTKQEEIISGIAILDINRDNAAPAGVSALCYSDCNDTLFFTASTELTENAIDDGEIGDSYLGMVQQISLKLEQEIIEPDMMINLSKSNSVFNTEKIESLCIEQHDKERIIFHLVSDNDDGKTGLFKIAVTGF